MMESEFEILMSWPVYEPPMEDFASSMPIIQGTDEAVLSRKKFMASGMHASESKLSMNRRACWR